MTPKQKRLLTPLSAPRWPRAPWPLNVIAAAVDGYYEAFFSVLIPPGYGGNHTKPITKRSQQSGKYMIIIQFHGVPGGTRTRLLWRLYWNFEPL